MIDLEFGPDGDLYIVEYERNGFLATGDAMLLGAIAFDKWGQLWLLDNVFAPTVRRVDMP